MLAWKLAWNDDDDLIIMLNRVRKGITTAV